MSFEGFYQKLCKNGHYWCTDVYVNDRKCPICKETQVWSNLVDETNETVGFVQLVLENIKSCPKCGHVMETKYKIPKENK